MDTEPQDTLTLDTVDALKVYFDPFRLKIIQLLANQPATIHEIAAKLNVPFTRLYYQFNLLEQHHIIRVVGTRNKAGAVEEKLYQITARNFVIDRQYTSQGDIPVAISASLQTVFDETHRDIEKNIRGGVIDLNQLSPNPSALLARKGILHLTPEQARQFHEELMEVVKKYNVPSLAEDASDYTMVVSIFPTQLDSD